MKQITILGGSGFLGSVLSDLLVRRKIAIILDNKKNTSLKNQKFINKFLNEENFERLLKDLLMYLTLCFRRFRHCKK